MYLVPWRLAQVKDISARERVAAAQAGRFVILLDPLRRPGLARLDVALLQIEQRQAPAIASPPWRYNSSALASTSR